MNSAPFDRIYITGCGAIGSLLGAGAVRAKLEYTMVPRTPARSEIRVVHNTQTVSLTQFSAIPAQTEANQLVIFPLKAYQLEAALNSWQPHLSVDTPVLLLQNGMGGYEIARKVLPPGQPIYMATTSHGALKKEPHTILHTGRGKTILGRLDNASLPVLDNRVMDALSAILPPVIWRQHMQHALWHKLAINAAINPLTALNDITNGRLLYTGYRQQLRELCSETVAVAASQGVTFSTAELLSDVLEVATNTAKNYSSMHQDYHHGRQTEIDAINGYIVSVGKKKGIDASRHAFLVEQIKQKPD